MSRSSPQTAMLPRRIVLVRHGQSQGNVNEAAYVDEADWRIALTPEGRKQAAEAGARLHEVLGGLPTMWYVSPYRRTQQTLAVMMGGSSGNPSKTLGYTLGVREEPRIAEQQFGNFQNVEAVIAAKEERSRFGRFWYRFPNGESGLDVFNRTTSFIATLFRDMSSIQVLMQPGTRGDGEFNIVIVTHGLTLRLFLMRWLRWSVAQFERSKNPPNGSIIIMERRQDRKGSNRWFALDAASAKILNVGAHGVSAHAQNDHTSEGRGQRGLLRERVV